MGSEEQLDRPRGRETPEMSALRAIIEALAFSSSEYMLLALDKLVANENLKSKGVKNMMPYLYAAGILSYAGREITTGSMAKMLDAIGVPMTKDLSEAFLKSGVKSHLPYVYSFFFILANGVPVTVDRMLHVVTAMGLEPDKRRAEEMLAFCEKYVKK